MFESPGWRDSFVTHHALCNKLENTRVPPIDAGIYGGADNMSLSLTSTTMPAPQLSAGIFPDNHQASAQPTASSGDVLCLGGGSNAGVGGASQFDHLMASSSTGSSMFRSQCASSSSYYSPSLATINSPRRDSFVTRRAFWEVLV
uniref:Uncharacterized protein n=1 Tax=Leersia perrieri TaxID=77586 RepID=A0A0D9XGL3_9ORYZ